MIFYLKLLVIDYFMRDLFFFLFIGFFNMKELKDFGGLRMFGINVYMNIGIIKGCLR